MGDVVLTVLFTLAGVASVGGFIFVFRAWRQQNESRARLEAAIVQLTEQAKAQVSILNGWVEISKEQVVQLTAFTAVMEQFRKSVIRDTAGDTFQEFDEQAASREHEVQEYMRTGMPRKDAEMRVNSTDVWRRMSVNG